MARPEAFGILWSFLQENLEKVHPEFAFIQRNSKGLSALISSLQNKENSTTKLVINTSRDLLGPDDFSASLNANDENLIVEALCEYAKVAELELLKNVWSFLQENIDKEHQKFTLLQKNQNGYDVFLDAFYSKDTTTIKFAIELLMKIFDADDFSAAIESGDENWLVEVLCQYSALAEFKEFSKFWTFLHENLNDNDRKKTFRLKSKNGHNIFINSIKNEDKATIFYVIDSARNVFGREDFSTSLKLKDESWLIDTLWKYLDLAEFEMISKFWSLFHEKLSSDDLKMAFILNNSDGLKLFAILISNKKASTKQFIIDTARDIFSRDDFSEAVQSESKSWLTDTLCHFATLADLQTFKIFWALLQENLDENDQKSVFIEKTARTGCNAFFCASKNKNSSTTDFIINIVRGLLGPDEFANLLKSADHSWIMENLGLYPSLAKSETFGIFHGFGPHERSGTEQISQPGFSNFVKRTKTEYTFPLMTGLRNKHSQENMETIQET